MEPTPENIEAALVSFYSTSTDKSSIHQWLNTVQVSPAAWAFSWQLLDPQKPAEVQFFGANCLHAKISKYWSELPVDQYEVLKSRLLNSIANASVSPKVVVTRLCVTLSTFVLQTMPEHWPNAVADIVRLFQHNIPNLSQTERCRLLLVILTVLPEEFQTCHITKHRRGCLRQELHQSEDTMIPLLVSLFNKECPAEITEQALVCMASWVKFGMGLINVDKMFPSVVQAVKNDQLFDKACEVLTEMFQHPEANKYPNTMKKLIAGILQLESLLDRYCQQQDMDSIHSLCQAVAAAAENNTRVLRDCLISSTPQDKDLVYKVIALCLKCTGLPGTYPIHESASNQLFTFWYSFQDDIMSSTEALISQYKKFACPVYIQLIEILIAKVQYPDETVYADMSDDEKELFRCYRQDISDTLMNCYGILSDQVLVQLCNSLSEAVNSSGTTRWQEVEGLFFLLSAVSENVNLDEQLYLPAMFQALPRIQFTNTTMISTALFLIGAYAEWIQYHPEVLGSLVPLLLQGIANKEVAMAASMALKDITRENQEHLKPYVSQIVDTIQTVIESGKLKSQESIRLMCCVGYALSVLPLQTILERLSRLLAPSIDQLRQLAQQDHTVAAKSAILVRISMFTWLFASLDTKRTDENGQQVASASTDHQPVAIILQQITDVLQAIIRGWITDSSVVDAICDLYKKALRTLMGDMLPLLNMICDMLASMFTAVPHPSILDLARQLIIMFDEERSQATTQKLFISLSNKCIECCRTGDQENTDLVEKYMAVVSQLLKKRSHVFTSYELDFDGMFSIALLGLSLPEVPTIKASCSFMVEILTKFGKADRVYPVVNQRGNVLTRRVIMCLGGEASRQAVDSLTDVICALCHYCISDASSWMHVCMSKDGIPSPRLTLAQKKDFISLILRHYTNKRQARELTKEFALSCRGLLGTEYGATT